MTSIEHHSACYRDDDLAHVLHVLVGTMTKVAHGYIRCSTEDQRTNGLSVEVQESKLRAWAMLNDVEIVIHCDAGISGKSMHNRPALQACLAAMRPGAVLVTCALDRLSRRTIDALQIAETLAKRGAELVSLKEQIPAGPAGKLILAVLASLAEIERDACSTRTKAAMEHLAAQGKYCGGKAPYGYRVDGEHVVPVDGEQAVIVEAKALRAAGLSLRAVAGTLAERGHRSRVGKPFGLTQVARFLDS